MTDLFAHADGIQRHVESAARFDELWNDPAARARRRRILVDLARGLIEEARRCRLEGWLCAAAWWLAHAGKERRDVQRKGDTQSPLRPEFCPNGGAVAAETRQTQRVAKGDMVSPLGGDL